ncbi:hypothetical protein RND81_13G119900 [Saponaria officinalis]|uniref:Protein kinase domain-containing protein n=1 Tax=Saponaria officinalis TaxID=3572 RepID=A0AAW1H5Y2_SAPOF
MLNKIKLILLYSKILLLKLFFTAMANLDCPKCGQVPVPFPLSTSPSCGDSLYKLRCTNGKLWFDTLNASSYEVMSITPEMQRLIIRPQSFMGESCINTDFRSGGIWLDQKLPFSISPQNTVLKINCTDIIFSSSMNCSSNSICYRYLKENPEAASRCGSATLCCSFTGGGSQNNHNIKITPAKCKVYTSFVGLPLDTQLPVSKWPEPGVAIQWVLPREPVCLLDSGCIKLSKSVCLPDVSSQVKRCLCKAGYHWDGFRGMCSKVIHVKCETKQCRKRRLKKQITQGFAYSIGVMLVLGSIVLLVFGQNHRIKRQTRERLVKDRQQILNANNTSGRSAKLFSGKDIKRATNNFSKDSVLGSGGFGEVYKGKLDDGTLIAAKRAKSGNTKGTDQVLNEVRVLSQVNHRSLVRLLGCCVELEEPVLVYEYISNGTLREHLYGGNSKDFERTRLMWNQRLVIAQQMAEGLAYLHFSAVPPIFHRDIKTTNILLDEKLDVKISDFGISRLVDTEATHMTTCAQGTLGYLDPQYYRTMQLTDKSDVYSFGVVLLELLTSQKVIDFSREVDDVSLVGYMRRMANQDMLMDAIDPFLKDRANKVELESMKAIGSIAMACLEDQRHNRPSTREIAEEIEYMLRMISNEGIKSR